MASQWPVDERTRAVAMKDRGHCGGMRTVVDAITGTLHRAATLIVAGRGGEPDTCLPWARVHGQARRMAGVLGRHGIRPGHRVGLLGDTSAGLVTAMQAVWLRGAAFTVLPPPGVNQRRGDLSHLSAIAADARFDLVVVGEECGETGAALAGTVKIAELSTLEHEARSAPPVAPVPLDLGDLAILQYTSGSTRRPRGIAVAHRNLAANLDAIEERVGRDTFDTATACWVSWLPLYHDMGLIAFLTLPMSRGCATVLQSPMAFARQPSTWLDRLCRHRATVTGAPNFAYGLAAQLLDGNPAVDLSTLRVMITGGEPIDAAMMYRFTDAARRHGLDPGTVTPAYGLAEATLAVSISPLGRGIRVDEVDRDVLERDGRAERVAGGRTARPLVRLGPPLAGTRVRITDPRTGEPTAGRVVGQIEVAGPSVAGRAGDGWLRTGDLGYLAEGELVICGRAKDVLFAAGRNVYPQDVEAAAAEVPGVRPGGAAAFGIPAEQGDRLVVVVESRDADRAALGRAVAVAVMNESGMAPADVAVVRPGWLPKTSSGKLRRVEARQRYLAGELADRDTRIRRVDRSLR
jgi:fatty-acyl-CoA synthase